MLGLYGRGGELGSRIVARGLADDGPGPIIDVGLGGAPSIAARDDAIATFVEYDRGRVRRESDSPIERDLRMDLGLLGVESVLPLEAAALTSRSTESKRASSALKYSALEVFIAGPAVR